MTILSARKCTALAAASAVLLGATLPATAQETGGFGTFLGRILFGFGLPRVAIETPQSVSVAEQSDLDRAQADTIRDVVADMPGVSMAGSESPLGQAFNIRGVGLTEQPASEARIIVKIDGAPKFFEQYRMGSLFTDIELFKRIEVLRGPASSTLYGSGALGGVVAFTTKDASDFLTEGDTDAIRTKLSFSTNGQGRYAGLIWAHDFGNVDLLTALNVRQSDDLKAGNEAPILGTSGESISGMIKANWDLSGEGLLKASLQRWVSSQDDGPLAATGGAVNVPTFGLIDRDLTDTTFVVAYENPFSDNPWVDLTVQLSWSDTTNVQSNHTNSPGGMLTCAPGQTQVVCDATYSYKTLNLKAENRAEFAFGGWDAFLTMGAEFTRIDRNATSELGPLGFHPEGVDNKVGLYAQGEFVLNDKLTLIPGLRIDLVDRTPGAGVTGAVPVEDRAVSPKLAALYDLSDSVSVFGSLARTERLPTLDELYSRSGTQGPAVNLEREVSDNIELGVSFDHTGVFGEDDTLQAKLTLFRNDVENLIQRSAPANPLFFENIATARFEGFEFEAGYEASDYYGRLSVSQVDAIDTTYDLRLTSNPADRYVLTLGKRLPDAGLEFGWRRTLNSAITTQSRSTTSGAITTTPYAGYVTHDLFLRWAPDQGVLEGATLDLSVENVTDKLYRNNLATDFGQGRTLKLTLTKTF
jgi:hemoglobin/transferrin/lactoferrin receptor protein